MDAEKIVGTPLFGFVYPLFQTGVVAVTQGIIRCFPGGQCLKVGIGRQKVVQVCTYQIGDILFPQTKPFRAGIDAVRIVSLVYIDTNGHKNPPVIILFSWFII